LAQFRDFSGEISGVESLSTPQSWTDVTVSLVLQLQQQAADPEFITVSTHEYQQLLALRHPCRSHA